MSFDLAILTTLNQLTQQSSVFFPLALFAAVPLLWLLEAWYAVVFVWHKRGGLTELGALAMGAVLANLVKAVLGFWWFRARPFAAGLAKLMIAPPWGAQSFPSGHAMFAFFLATLLAIHYWHWPVKAASRPRAHVYAVVAYLLAGAVAVARVAVGVHYPSDVLAGALIGTTFGFATRRLEVAFRRPRSVVR